MCDNYFFHVAVVCEPDIADVESFCARIFLQKLGEILEGRLHFHLERQSSTEYRNVTATEVVLPDKKAIAWTPLLTS